MVWVLVALLVLATIGFVGWKVASRKDTTTSPTPTSQTPPPAQSPPSSEPADPSEAGKYLVIKEWGVRFPLPAQLQGDVTYGLVTSSSSDVQTAWFEVGKIASLAGSNCKLAPTDVSGNSGRSGGIGVYATRRTTQASAQEERSAAFNVTYAGKWYYVGAPKGSCLTDQSKAQLESEAVGSLVSALRELKPIQQ